jgi:branched-chain amino acid transport system permease protein
MMEQITWMLRIFQKEILAVPGKAIILAFFIIVYALPLFIKDPYILNVLIIAAIYAIFATSWDLISGYTGQVNLGHALFFGVGAYTVAILNVNYGCPSWIAIIIGSIAAVIVGLIAGIPALRLRGFYLALVTLSFPIILAGVVMFFADFTGGENGIPGVKSLSNNRMVNYYIVYLIMTLSIFIMYKLTDASSKFFRTGVIIQAIRDDEISARNSGINTTRYKLLAFAFSGFFAGLAGGLYAVTMRVTGLSTLELGLTFQAILWTIFGGISTIYGPVMGVFILYPLIEFLNLFPTVAEFRWILFALILLFVLLFMPEGMGPWIRDKLEVNCTRCKLPNIFTRRKCRVCNTALHLETKKN